MGGEQKWLSQAVTAPNITTQMSPDGLEFELDCVLLTLQRLRMLLRDRHVFERLQKLVAYLVVSI